MNDILELYKNWLIDIVTDNDHLYYNNLLDCLFHIEFIWSVNGDENRAADGIHLRSVFCDQMNLSNDILVDDPCSVLEMMIALAVRGSEDILWDGENNWTPYLFWTMIDNLGLEECTDGAFDEAYVYEKIDIFLARKYDKNGVGGLFQIFPNPKNFQKLEIWYQMQFWISANFT